MYVCCCIIGYIRIDTGLTRSVRTLSQLLQKHRRTIKSYISVNSRSLQRRYINTIVVVLDAISRTEFYLNHNGLENGFCACWGFFIFPF
jgi:hypothetical protein